MENVVSIVNTRTNPLEFDITIQGVDDKETAVKFVIETGEVQFGFTCHSHAEDKWSVDIPPLPQLPQTSYNFHIEVVVDGYYFEPYRGTLNVTAEPEVKASDVSKPRPTVTVEPSGSVSVREEQATRQLAKKRLQEKKPEVKAVPVVETEKDRIVKKALQSVQESTGTDKAYKMGRDDAKNGRRKKNAENSFGVFAKDYYRGYNAGTEEKSHQEADKDHEAWQEKVAAKRQGADYHESADKPERKSNLAGALQKLEEEPKLSEQAQKVRNILNKGKKK